MHPGSIEFRVAETPVFIPKDFTQKILDACESIVDIIVDPKFNDLEKMLSHQIFKYQTKMNIPNSSLLILGYASMKMGNMNRN